MLPFLGLGATQQQQLRPTSYGNSKVQNSNRPIITMEIPATIISGSVGYIVLLCVALAGLQFSKGTGALSKDNAEIGNVVVSIATFAMWLFWLCAWMHQWHPLIKPIYEG